ncbi:GGDEF domain-containing protein [Azospirillum sp. RWY-5-1]|uniref:GGDEF domain-containing protein n=1 Tax=Azospirillum oleiclasticum TaxID=2735135 RepID=A0ABX2T541_9PROT|nr:diguanylate cyclase [Azospirillum oleiclasticum]NYZ11795.1 GGDEF domain-containing protein [Azospirillum oleiclasticum]NYZ18955.1 GGDEF domain-containing protein [Azospirillum oleiclasticum]
MAGALLVVGLAFLLSVLIGGRSERQLEREIGRSLAEAAYLLVDKLATDMSTRANQVGILAKIDGMRDWTIAQKVMDELKAKDRTLSWIGVIDRSGVVHAASDGILIGANLTARPVFHEGVKGLFIGDVHDAVLLATLLPNPTGEAMKFVDVATPLIDGTGTTVGVLAAHFSWNWAREVQDTLLKPMGDRRGLETFIVGADGVVLMGPSGTVGKTLSIPSVAAARTQGIGWAVEPWPDGGTYVTGYARESGRPGYDGLGWTVLARQPAEAAYADAAALRQEIRLWGLGLAAVFSALIWYAAGLVTRPLRAIADAAERLRKGEPGVQIPEITRGVVEVRDLSRSLRTLVASLTDTRLSLAQMEDAAYQDRLTALPNRRFFEQYAESITAWKNGPPVTVLVMDLDGFKPINDTLGHHAGDAVLRQVAARIASCLRSEDVVARLGGDEFVVVISGELDKEPPDAEEIAGRLIASVNEPVLVAGQAVRVGCSIGIAVWPAHGATLFDTVARADEALYAAKRAGRNMAVRYATGERTAQNAAG